MSAHIGSRETALDVQTATPCFPKTHLSDSFCVHVGNSLHSWAPFSGGRLGGPHHSMGTSVGTQVLTMEKLRPGREKQ